MVRTKESRLTRQEIQSKLKTHKRELHQKFGVRRIGLFGSYARDEASQLSDIDFVVDLENPDLFMMSSLQRYLKDLLHVEVDVVRYRDKMNPVLKKRIEQDVHYV